MNYPIKSSLSASFLAALVGVGSCYLATRLLWPEDDGTVYRIVWGNLISPVILLLFFLAMALLLGKRLRLSRQENLNRQFLSQLMPRLYDHTTRIEDVSDHAEQLRDNLLAARWRAHQLFYGSAQAKGLDMKLLADETEHLGNSYTAARFVVWSLPIVGFIGTVWGIGLSISFFSETMSTSQAGASVSTLLQQNIPLVTQGLSTAFDTTLLALALSLPATALLVLTEKRERDFLLDMDERWRSAMATRPSALAQLRELDIDVAGIDVSQHSHAVNESLRDIREEAFDRLQRRIQSGD